MKMSPFSTLLILSLTLPLPACQKVEGQEEEEQQHHAEHKILVTSPVARDVISTQPYVCQIHSRRHIEVCALKGGYVEEILVKEGQVLKQGDTMFSILPTLYRAKLDAETAEVQLAQIEFMNTEKLFQQKVVAQPEVALAQARLAKAQAQMKLAEAELNFATIKAPFDGIIDHQHHQQGSLIEEGDVLTTLSDNDVMWAYFNVPESRYLEYQANKDKGELKIELMLANHTKFPHVGTIGAIEADFNNETGNIAFRGDFPNPDRLLRHGQTGTVLLNRVVKAIVIPQRATYEILAKNYVYVITDEETKDGGRDKNDEVSDEGHVPAENASDEVKDVETHAAEHEQKHDVHDVHDGTKPHGEHGVVRQREIEILGEQDDIYLIKDGIGVHDRIILEGIRQVRDGDEVEYEFVDSEDALDNLKYHAE
jgi:membrane fusion protein (multidrug efflux system)